MMRTTTLLAVLLFATSVAYADDPPATAADQPASPDKPAAKKPAPKKQTATAEDEAINPL